MYSFIDNTKKHFLRGIVFIACIFTITLYAISCKNSGNPTEDDADLTKMDYTPQVNEVEVITLERVPFKRQLVSNGKLVAKQKAQLSFASSGTISSIKAENGSYVHAGAVIANLDSRAALATVESAKVNLQRAELEMYDRLVGLGYQARDTISMSKELLESVKMQSGYKSALNEYARAKTELSMGTLTAPFSGKVADISKKVYEQAGGVFCTLINDRLFDLDFAIMSSELSFCQKGMKVKVLPFGANNQDAVYGAITNINPTVNSNGQIKITASVANNGALIDGIDVKVLVEKEAGNQLVVPKRAVVIRDHLDVIFTYTEDGFAHWVYVNILSANEDSYSIEANSERRAQLSEGDMVIVKGNLNLADKSKVSLKK